MESQDSHRVVVDLDGSFVPIEDNHHVDVPQGFVLDLLQEQPFSDPIVRERSRLNGLYFDDGDPPRKVPPVPDLEVGFVGYRPKPFPGEDETVLKLELGLDLQDFNGRIQLELPIDDGFLLKKLVAVDLDFSRE